jgi:hypothetical protein
MMATTAMLRTASSVGLIRSTSRCSTVYRRRVCKELQKVAWALFRLGGRRVLHDEAISCLTKPPCSILAYAYSMAKQPASASLRGKCMASAALVS